MTFAEMPADVKNSVSPRYNTSLLSTQERDMSLTEFCVSTGIARLST